jgi:regulator of nucleoside diphosphate kinase
MTANASALLRPAIILADTDADTLLDLALALGDRSPDTCRMLIEEIDRATIVAPADLPEDVVSVGSLVRFRDAASGTVRTIELVYPSQADVGLDRISVLSPIGAGLIGLSEGQSISWPDLQGRYRELSIEKVTRRSRADAE